MKWYDCIYDYLDDIDDIASPFIINAGSIILASRISILSYFLADEQNSFALTVGVYTIILTSIKVAAKKWILHKKTKIIADVSLNKDDEFSLKQKIKLSNNKTRNMYLRVKIEGNVKRLKSNFIRLVFPMGVTAQSSDIDALNENNKENVLLIPLKDICENDISYIKIQLLQSVRSFDGEKNVSCTLVENKFLIKFVTNNLRVCING